MPHSVYKRGIFLTIMEPGVSIEYKSLLWSLVFGCGRFTGTAP